jgi:hypothetical protein
VLRVLTLVLVTYHFGDAAGHAFHDYAGYAEICIRVRRLLCVGRKHCFGSSAAEAGQTPKSERPGREQASAKR